MSKKETQNTDQAPEKIVTRYDRKMQRRKEQKEKARREERIGRIAGIVLIALLVCIVVSFPIRSWIAVNGTYIEVNGEKVTKPQFDYHYSNVSNDFINQYYYTYYYYFGIDLTGDLSTMQYSEKLTWKDYFEELAVQNLAQTQSLVKEGRAAGFTYDVTEDYNSLMDKLTAAASETGVTLKNYLQQVYGPYATQFRIKPYLENAMYAAAYYDEKAEHFTPSMDEIEAHYAANVDDYDSVDYYVLVVDAELPTEPTELADPVEEDEAGEGTGDDAEAAYEPSDAEIAAAMEAAREKADAAQATIKADGELRANVTYAKTTSLLREWLFDSERKSGDTTVIEDSSYHRYYALRFEGRYLDRTRTMDIRLIVTAEENGQEILEEWKSGAATEESFAELCDKYNSADVISAEGGLREAVLPSGLTGELRDWLTDGARAKGDTTVISPEDDSDTYVLYYLASNEEEWVMNIRSTLREEALSEYMMAFLDDIDVKDPKGRLPYLKVREQEAADAANAAQNDDGGDDAEDSASE